MKIPKRRFIVMLVGLFIMGIGIGIFKISLMGNDPHSAMVMAMADLIGIDFSILLVIVNCIWFVIEIAFARELIGVGTFFNWIGVGFVASWFARLINHNFTIPEAFLPRLLIMLVGVVVLSFSCAMYQAADLGISPYDSLCMVIEKKLPIPYFWCRLFTDCVCALTAYLLGGIVGLGTLTCALFLGPFISFFTKHAARPMCGYKD